MQNRVILCFGSGTVGIEEGIDRAEYWIEE
jgi:hypothetical protein